MRDGFILLITDEPRTARTLAGSLARLLPCIALLPGEGLPPGRFQAAVLDVALDDAAILAGIRRAMSRVRARGAPCLCLARDLSPVTLARARALGAAQVLPPTASQAELRATLLALIEAEAEARAAEPLRQARAQAAEANALVSRLFQAAANGVALSLDDIDAGTEIVLEAIAEAGIRAWLDVIRTHEIGVYQHSLGVAGYAGAFAGLLGFRRHDQERLVRAALLHDVGKARIPLAILNKPSSLSAEEMAVMRRHPVIGAALLARQPGFDAEILDVVRHHHEMLDGSGYPDGLRGGAIGDLVRLVTICDICSALTERRPYRAPIGPAEAWAAMDRMGQKLDRQLLAAFRPVAMGLAAAAVP
ncbi:HD-GYP domain-containing protein [Methylobacterium nodulans]|uniref:Metal dependent phosphohydrolase n=1 Tax=Methylobacterium nodulans (strain LMG 21967 / CNCM I-2342 / ORS 2060) TaxID=460265 RepID=B8IN86_METNO|nr:HD domain-containing phosphohydrolase [Methylobacterium nodulans]ACL62202.1 metal dependent phosphohydrolase [Methylobacterium nodulans ORS 2060]